MSLSIAIGVLVVEAVVTALVMFILRDRARRARWFIRMFGVFAGLTGIVAYAHISSVETSETYALPPGTWLATALCAVNALVFIGAFDARERLQYGSAPASER